MWHIWETCMCWTMEARRREVSSQEWSVRNWLRHPTRCHGLFGLLLPLLVIEPPPLGFVGVEVMCICAVLPFSPCFFSPRKGSRVSSHYRLCVLRWAVCCVSSLSSSVIWKALASLPHSLLAQSGSALHRRGSGSCHCSLGHCSSSCLSVCLLVCFSLLTRASVFLCHIAAAIRQASCCLSCCKVSVWHWFGACGRDKFTHSS